MGIGAGSRVDYMNSCKVVTAALLQICIASGHLTSDGSCDDYGQQLFNCNM